MSEITGHRAKDTLRYWASTVKVPLWLRAVVLLCAGFALIVTLVGAAIGTPLAAPNERVSLALGFNAALPVLLGFTGYALAQLVNMAVTRRFEPGRIGRAAAVDMTVFAVFVLTVYFHFNLKMWVPLINPLRFDEAYMASDRFLSPVLDLFRWLRALLPTGWEFFDQLYQLGFVLMFIVSFAVLAVSRDRHYPHFVTGILLVLILGGFGYLVAPAVGPFLFEDGVNKAATGAQAGMWDVYRDVVAAGPSWIAVNGSDYFTGALAAMPSLHVAHATVITYYLHRSRLGIRWPFMLLWVFILIESVVSRWHYLVDAPAGMLVALAAILIANRLCDDDVRTMPHPTQSEPS